MNMTFPHRWKLAALVAVTAALAACTPEQQTEVAQAGRAAGQAATRATDAATAKAKDAAVSAAVNGAFAADTSLSALRIDVDTVDGRVALRGTAPDAASRERATQLARSTAGVREVDNQLLIQPSR